MALGIFIGLAMYGLFDMVAGLGDNLRADAEPKPTHRQLPDIEVMAGPLVVSQTYCTPNFDITINPN